MTKSIVNILEDNEALKNYINSLEQDINSTEDVDDKIDLILTNILKNCDDFKDRRALKASLIDSVTELIKLKSELPMKRIQSKKSILDIMTKKEELEIKKTQATASAALAGGAVDVLTYLYTTLDKLNIHPIQPDESVLEAECIDIIDSLSEENEENITEHKIVEIEKYDSDAIVNVDSMIDDVVNKSEINILEIQSRLDD